MGVRHSWKDYEAESARLHALIQEHKQSDGHTLLDVACGTAGHVPYLQANYQVEGLDLDEKMLAVAQTKYPDTAFHHANMIDFDLGKQFDVLVCLFSSIGYVGTVDALNQTLATFKKHLKLGGVVIVEPWLEPHMVKDGVMYMSTIDEPHLKLTRLNQTRIEGNISILNFNYLIGTPSEGVRYFVEQHHMTLFTQQEYENAFTQAGLTVKTAELSGRGLYFGF